MNEHSALAPSSMARTLQCPASVTLAARYPEPRNDAAREGTAAHWVMSEVLAGEVCCEGQIAPNGVVVTDEMIDAAELVYDHVRRVAGGPGLLVEQRVSIPRIHPQCFGTPDVVWWQAPRARLHVWDLKFGHAHVGAFENAQLAAYAAGLCSDLDGFEEQACAVHLHIVQPRNYHRDGPIRTWTTTAAALRTMWNLMAAAAEEALGPNPKARTGPECKYCPARHACPAIQTAALSVLDTVGAALPLDLPGAAAGAELRRLRYAGELLAARVSGLEAQVEDALRRGEQVAHWALEPSAGREAWTKPNAEILALGELYGLPISKTVPLTPKQARDKGLPAEVVKMYSARPPGPMKLVPDDGSAARRAFGT